MPEVFDDQIYCESCYIVHFVDFAVRCHVALFHTPSLGHLVFLPSLHRNQYFVQDDSFTTAL